MKAIRMNQLSKLIIVAMIAAAGSARADVAEIKWNEAGQAAQEFQIPPAKFAEWCAKLRTGDKVRWSFEAGAATNFNIHYHEGNDVRFPAKQDGVTSADGTLEVTTDQGYCWMWSNKSAAAVTVKASASRTR